MGYDEKKEMMQVDRENKVMSVICIISILFFTTMPYIILLIGGFFK